MRLEALIIPVVAFGCLPLAYCVHCTLDRICIRHARRFCRGKGLESHRARCQPAFEQTGRKTEFSLVQLDCFNASKERRLVLLLVWPFGVRKLISDEVYPDCYESHWPE